MEARRTTIAGQLRCQLIRPYGYAKGVNRDGDGRTRTAIDYHLVMQKSTPLQASSYASALQGEPLGGFTHLAGHETVAGELPFERDIGVR
jgi:hypothetical protein